MVTLQFPRNRPGPQHKLENSSVYQGGNYEVRSLQVVTTPFLRFILFDTNLQTFYVICNRLGYIRIDDKRVVEVEPTRAHYSDCPCFQ